MKVIFDYNKTEDGYNSEMHCSEVPKLPDGTIDVEEYANCFKAIVAHIVGNPLTNPKFKKA